MHCRPLYLVICVLSSRFSSVTAQQLVSSGKNITASSQYIDWVAGKAVDGNTDRRANPCRCCAATMQQLNPWYKLDLGQQYKIYRISVLGRGADGDEAGGFGQTLKNMEIKLDTTESDEQILTQYTGNGFTYNYTLPTPHGGRYLTLTLRGMTQYFTICELSVYAVCINGTYGQECRETCGQCYNNEVCNHVDGRCTRCAAGYKGVDCKKECEDGTFGLGCNEE